MEMTWMTAELLTQSAKKTDTHQFGTRKSRFCADVATSPPSPAWRFECGAKSPTGPSCSWTTAARRCHVAPAPSPRLKRAPPLSGPAARSCAVARPPSAPLGSTRAGAPACASPCDAPPWTATTTARRSSLSAPSALQTRASVRRTSVSVTLTYLRTCRCCRAAPDCWRPSRRPGPGWPSARLPALARCPPFRGKTTRPFVR